MSEIKYLKYLKLDIENNLLFIEIYFFNHKDVIKIPVDKLTANSFRAVLKEKPFKENEGAKHEYYYAGLYCDKLNDIFAAYVEIRLNKKRLKRKIGCSKIFFQNMLWIVEVDNFEDYNYLK